MPRLSRYLLAGRFHHITVRATGRELLFIDDEDRAAFIRLLLIVIARYQWTCHAYCLMGTHYHLIIEAPLERLSPRMNFLNGVYCARFNRRHGRRGRLLADRFASFVIRDEDHLHAALAYVLDNPVKAGLCARADAWPWSGLGVPPRDERGWTRR